MTWPKAKAKAKAKSKVKPVKQSNPQKDWHCPNKKNNPSNRKSSQKRRKQKIKPLAAHSTDRHPLPSAHN